MPVDDGPGRRPRPEAAAVLAHGAGSAPRFVRRAFGPALAVAGVPLLVAPRDLSGDVAAVVASIDAAVRDLEGAGHRVAFVGGVSLGAHAAATWAASRPAGRRVDGLLLALPAWTGPPDHVAAATAAAAADLAAGVDVVLARLRADPALAGDWVLDQLAADWPSYPAGALAAALRRAAGCAGPGEATLRRLAVPTGVVALEGDPLHPAAVAERWARLVPRAAVEQLPRRAADAGVDVVGAAALRAWRRAAAPPS